MTRLESLLAVAAAVLIFSGGAVRAAVPDQERPTDRVTLSPAQLFDYAAEADRQGDFAAAETAYRALATNPDLETRTEARFRLGMMLADRQHRYAEAATEFRRVLDEKPRAARVRLELARMDALLGRTAAAARELRAAQAGGLPPEVQQAVRFYAGALEASRPSGFNLGIALAPDTNVNRATRSDTLGTIVGDLTLDEDAQARSGIGLALRGQGFVRIGPPGTVRLLTQLSAQASLYREADFNDLILALQSGPEIAAGSGKVNLNAALGARWYGGRPYSRSFGLDASWLRAAGRQAQIRLGGGVMRENNLRSDLQDATVYSARLHYDRAFSAVLGGGAQLTAQRSAARDSGYSTATGGASLYLFREAGPVTAVADLGYSRLEADRRLFLYPRRRIDNRLSGGLGLTLRSLRLGRVAPVVSVRYERNRSTVEIYDYERFSGEVGLTASF